MDQKGLIEFTLRNGVPEVLCHWAKEIEKTANKFCKDPEFKRIQFKIDMNRNAFIVAPEYEDVFCLIQSFKQHEMDIPEPMKKILHHSIGVYIIKRHNKYEK
ncbi:MAG TPA: hypothetical protein VF248_03545 [Nitrososphaeraceae archaeon]|jgi:hypothetical protein